MRLVFSPISGAVFGQHAMAGIQQAPAPMSTIGILMGGHVAQFRARSREILPGNGELAMAPESNGQRPLA